MAIVPLQGAPVPVPSGKAAASRKEKGGDAGFDALLDALREPPAVDASSRQAAAELFRIQMLQTSLTLLEEPGAPASSGGRAVQSLLATLASDGVYQQPAATKEAGVGYGSVPPEAVGSTVDADLIGETAAHYLGMPYRFGGEGASGIDCSSFVQQVFREHSVDLPRTAREQIQVGTDVPVENLKKGDLVFFQTYAN